MTSFFVPNSIRTAELNRRVQVTATDSWGLTPTETVGREDDNLACAQTGLPGKEMHLPVIWTSYQFPVPLHSCKLRLSQSRVRT